MVFPISFKLALHVGYEGTQALAMKYTAYELAGNMLLREIIPVAVGCLIFGANAFCFLGGM